MTNADAIRNMTNEQINSFICENSNCQTCHFSTYKGCQLDEWLEKDVSNENTCVCCGEPIPEGTQVCKKCGG